MSLSLGAIVYTGYYAIAYAWAKVLFPDPTFAPEGDRSLLLWTLGCIFCLTAAGFLFARFAKFQAIRRRWTFGIPAIAGLLLLALGYYRSDYFAENYDLHKLRFTAGIYGWGEHLDLSALQPGEQAVVKKIAIPDRGFMPIYQYELTRHDAVRFTIRNATAVENPQARRWLWPLAPWSAHLASSEVCDPSVVIPGPQIASGPLSDADLAGLSLMVRYLRRHEMVGGFGYDTYRFEYFRAGAKIGEERFASLTYFVGMVTHLWRAAKKDELDVTEDYRKLARDFHLPVADVERMVTFEILQERLSTAEKDAPP